MGLRQRFTFFQKIQPLFKSLLKYHLAAEVYVRKTLGTKVINFTLKPNLWMTDEKPLLMNHTGENLRRKHHLEKTLVSKN